MLSFKMKFSISCFASPQQEEINWGFFSSSYLSKLCNMEKFPKLDPQTTYSHFPSSKWVFCLRLSHMVPKVMKF